MASRDEKRRTWFQLGVDALDFSFDVSSDDGLPGPYYVCPLCWQLFDETELEPPEPGLTVEDVPPLSVGGAPMVLTCKPCNNRAGTRVDADAGRHAELRQMLDGEGGSMTVTVDGGVTAELELGSDGEPLYCYDPKRSNPAVYDQLMERLAEGGTGSPAQRFDVDFKLGYSPTDASLSYLRAAYLVVFARYGYSAVLSDAFRPLRRALKTLDPDVLPNAPTLTRVPGYAQTWFSGEHDELGSVLVVAFEQCVIVLPNPLEHDESWWQIAPTPQSSFDLKRLIPWPTRPEHLLDLERPKVAVPGETEVMDLFGD